MRKLIYAINLTLDGCCQHTKVNPPTGKLIDYYLDLLRESDTFLYGRKTYQLMVPYWPDEAKKNKESAYAQAFVKVDKMVVVSKSLDKADGENTSFIGSNLYDEILKLKQQPGKNILTGGIDLPTQLIQLGLVDEIRVVIMPIIAGEGKRLFDDVSLPQKLMLKLIDTKVFESGSVVLKYGKG